MGKYSAFERVLVVFVTILGLSFVIDSFFGHPSPKQVLTGLIPSVPENGAMIVAAMVGTTLAGSVVVMRSFVITDKGWTIDDLKHAEKDSLVSGILIFIISAIVMAVSAATLHVRGLQVENAIDMAQTLVPIAGNFAATSCKAAAKQFRIFETYMIKFIITDSCESDKLSHVLKNLVFMS